MKWSRSRELSQVHTVETGLHLIYNLTQLKILIRDPDQRYGRESIGRALRQRKGYT